MGQNRFIVFRTCRRVCGCLKIACSLFGFFYIQRSLFVGYDLDSIVSFWTCSIRFLQPFNVISQVRSILWVLSRFHRGRRSTSNLFFSILISSSFHVLFPFFRRPSVRYRKQLKRVLSVVTGHRSSAMSRQSGIIHRTKF